MKRPFLLIGLAYGVLAFAAALTSVPLTAQSNRSIEEQCDAGNRLSCQALSLRYRRAGPQPDAAQELKYARKACDAGSTWLCEAIPNMEAQLNATTAAAPSATKATSLRQKAKSVGGFLGGMLGVFVQAAATPTPASENTPRRETGEELLQRLTKQPGETQEDFERRMRLENERLERDNGSSSGTTESRPTAAARAAAEADKPAPQPSRSVGLTVDTDEEGARLRAESAAIQRASVEKRRRDSVAHEAHLAEVEAKKRAADEDTKARQRALSELMASRKAACQAGDKTKCGSIARENP